MTRIELKQLSRTRLKEAKILHRDRCYDGAIYVAGYVLETALKARICKNLQTDYPLNYQAFRTHNFEQLMKLSGLQALFEAEMAANVNFKTNWSLLADWSENYRYKAIGTSNRQDVEDFFNALEDVNDGILTWIKKKW